MAEPTQLYGNSVSPEELDASFSGPAPSANRFFVNLSASGVRVAFAEQVPNSSKIYFRSAAILCVADAIQLHKVLNSLLAPFDQAIDPEQKEAGQASADG